MTLLDLQAILGYDAAPETILLLAFQAFEMLENSQKMLTQDQLERVGVFNFLYEPDDVLKNRLEDYKSWCKDRQGEDAGKLMEELAYLSFRCLKGWNSIKSGQSYSGQHDLIISGIEKEWQILSIILHLPRNGGKILVEAKNQDNPITDQQMSRLGFIIQNKYLEQCYLGVFFSRTSATGFPTNETEQFRTLHDARASQVLFHAITRKYLIVLDDSHLLRLGERGSLPRIMEALIREVEDGLGETVGFDENWQENRRLPQHLAKYETSKRKQSKTIKSKIKS